jgi:RNA polymerase sigma-70 factor (ECF subfamily)
MTTPHENQSKFELTQEIVMLLTDAQPRMLAFLLKRLGDRDQAHEVLQEVNMVICRRAAEFESGSNFMAWAFTIARFQVMAFRKRQSRDRLVFPDDLAAALDEIDSSLHSPERDAGRAAALQECLRLLSPAQRDLVVRRYAESVSVKALAGELDKTANAVSMLLHRTREQLMNCLEKRLGEAR